jgi:metal-responsive CopG/Arc/MetJ family transcriptional regulator
MANQRAKDQKLLPIAAKEQFIAEMDSGLEQIGCSNRSQFIREAIIEKLARENIHIPRALAAAPARTNSAKVRTASKQGADKLRRRHTPAAG